MTLLSIGYALIFPRNSSQGVVRNEMGNLESSAKINVDQLQGSSSRELNISRSLRYEEYQQVRRGFNTYLRYFLIINLQLMAQAVVYCHFCTVTGSFIFFLRVYLHAVVNSRTFKLLSFMCTCDSGQMLMQSWELRDQATVIIT